MLNEIKYQKKTVSQIVSIEMATSNVLNRKNVLSLIKNDFLECRVLIPASKREAKSDPGITHVEGYVQYSALLTLLVDVGLCCLGSSKQIFR